MNKIIWNFGEILKQHREEKNFSQNELAKRARVALRTIVNIETSKNSRNVRFDVIIRLAVALETNPQEWLKNAGHNGISESTIAHILKKSGILNFYGEDEPSAFFKRLSELITTSPPVIVTMTYCTYSAFAHQLYLAEKIAPLVDSGKLFLGLVCAYPKIVVLGTQRKSNLSRIYSDVGNEVISIAKAVKKQITKQSYQSHVAAFSLKESIEPTCFPQVGLSQFRQILIQYFPNSHNRNNSVFELATWISFFQDKRERWIRIYPTPEIMKNQEDDYQKISSAWQDYVSEIHANCDLSSGWKKDGSKFSPWAMLQT